MRAGHVLTMLLIVAAAILAGILAERFAVSADWTASNRNSLTPASQRVLASLDAGPMTITAYIYPGADRKTVRARLARYARAADNVELSFVDPARHPKKVRALHIGKSGAVRLRYQGRSQTITDYSEPGVTNALQRLSTAGRQWIVFATGHGERQPTLEAPAGYSVLKDALDNQGLQVRTLSLANAAAIPGNTAVLVIASPQHDFLPGEVTMIRRYVARGGNILWLHDPGPSDGLVPLAQALGIHWSHGTLVYPDYKKLGTGSPAIALVSSYPSTPITDHLKQLTLFPFAGGVQPLRQSNWHSRVFLRSSPRSWLETGPLHQGHITYQPGAGDNAGPVTFGLAETRPRHHQSPAPPRRARAHATDRTQRAAFIADSDFMANGHIDQLGNKTLALSVVQWLAHRDAQIAVNVPKAPDAHLQMAPARIRDLWWLYVLGLPAGLLLLGLGRWWLRRRR